MFSSCPLWLVMYVHKYSLMLYKVIVITVIYVQLLIMYIEIINTWIMWLAYQLGESMQGIETWFSLFLSCVCNYRSVLSLTFKLENNLIFYPKYFNPLNCFANYLISSWSPDVTDKMSPFSFLSLSLTLSLSLVCA